MIAHNRNIKKQKRAKEGKYKFKLLLGLGLVVLFYISYKLSGEVYKQNQINQEVFALQNEIEKLGQDNRNLNELISYLQTDEYKEKEAKDKLNLIKDGEELVLVKEKERREELPKDEISSEAQVFIEKPNYYWWWHYFFSLN